MFNLESYPKTDLKSLWSLALTPMYLRRSVLENPGPATHVCPACAHLTAVRAGNFKASAEMIYHEYTRCVKFQSPLPPLPLDVSTDKHSSKVVEKSFGYRG